jgi:hypothetical protein
VTNLQTRRRKTIQDQKLHRNITACRHQKRIIGYALIPWKLTRMCPAWFVKCLWRY